MQVRIPGGKMPLGKRLKTAENHTCFSIFFSILLPTQRLKLSDKQEQNLPDAPCGERMETVLMS